MNVFRKVNASITTREVAKRYGIEANHHNKAFYSFHNDCHPSLFMDDDHYYCYTCGKCRDVIDLTSKLYGLSILDTV